MNTFKRRKFASDERFAIWHEHNKRCAYCPGYLRREDVCLDHVIPLKRVNNLEEFRRLRDICQLRPDFDPNAYYNIVPCHQSCNRLKWDDELPSFIMMKALHRAEAAADNIEKYIDKMRSDDFLFNIELIATNALKKDNPTKFHEACLKTVVQLMQLCHQRIAHAWKRSYEVLLDNMQTARWENHKWHWLGHVLTYSSCHLMEELN